MKLNKDGTPRKKGSGRTKGSNSFVNYTLKQLTDQLPEFAKVVVSRKWSESVRLEGGESHSVAAIHRAKGVIRSESRFISGLNSAGELNLFLEKPTEETVAPIQVTTIDFGNL